MAIRDFQFVVGAETSTLPSAGTPSSPGDTVTLGYADDHYVQGGTPVADLTALAAVAAADRANGDALLVLSSNTFYRFDSTSVASADGLRVVAPASGSGRWFRVRPGETASNGNYAVAGDINVGGSAIITGNVEVTGNATINGTLTAINSTTLEVVDANILINNGGNTASADLADAGFTVEISDGTNAKVGYNSTLASKFMAGNVGSESEIITASTTQTLTGDKTFDTAPTLKELASTPATPSTGYQRLYPKTDGKFYKLDDAGLEQAIGTGAGGGSINFILNPDAETDTAGWATYLNTAQSTPVTGTGGSANVTWTRSTSSPLRGTASFLFTKDAANRQGQGVSYAFTLDSADVSKTIQISFDFDGSLTGYAAGDLTAYIYDVSNSTLIVPAAVFLAGARYQFQTTFVASTSTSYRLILHVASTSATAYTAKFDNVVVGPQLLTLGTPVTAQTQINSFVTPNPTRFGTVTNLQVFRKQDGDQYEVRGTFTAGTLGGTNNTDSYITLSSALDISKFPGTNNRFYVGEFYVADAGGGNYGSDNRSGILFVDTAQPSRLYFSTSTVGASFTIGVSGSTGSTYGFRFVAPFSEIAGSGVYLSTAQPQYIFSTATTTTAGGSDLVSFGYGPQGVAFNSIASTTDNSITTYRVRTLTPIQATDKIELQFSRDRLNWTKLGDDTAVQAGTFQSVKNYGMGIIRVSGSTTDIDVYFGNNGRAATGGTFASNGDTWSGATSFYWRVVKIPGQVQVATPAISTLTPALFTFNTWNPSDLVGTNTDANSLGTGGGISDQNVSFSSLSAGTVTVTFNTAGLYEIEAAIAHNSGANASLVQLVFTYGGTASSTYIGNWQSRVIVPGGANNPNVSSGDYFTVSASAGQTLTVRGQFLVVGSGSTSNHTAIARYFIKRIK